MSQNAFTISAKDILASSSKGIKQDVSGSIGSSQTNVPNGNVVKNLTSQQISNKLNVTLKKAPEELEASVKAFML